MKYLFLILLFAGCAPAVTPSPTIVPLPVPAAGTPTYGADFAWTDSGGGTTATYYVYISSDNATFNLVQITPNLYATVTGLLYGINYWAEVSAIDSTGALLATSPTDEFSLPAPQASLTATHRTFKLTRTVKSEDAVLPWDDLKGYYGNHFEPGFCRNGEALPPNGRFFDQQGKPLTGLEFDIFNLKYVAPGKCEWIGSDHHMYEFQVFGGLGTFSETGKTRTYTLKQTVEYEDPEPGSDRVDFYYDEKITVTDLGDKRYRFQGSLTDNNGFAYSVDQELEKL